MCKYSSDINVGVRNKSYRLDCLNCIKTPGVQVSLTQFYRYEMDRSILSEWHAEKYAIYFVIPGDDKNTFKWEFDLNQDITKLTRIEKDCNSPVVCIFDKIMDINLDNFQQKTKTCLIFS
jgi:hypothetical protein